MRGNQRIANDNGVKNQVLLILLTCMVFACLAGIAIFSLGSLNGPEPYHALLGARVVSVHGATIVFKKTDGTCAEEVAQDLRPSWDTIDCPAPAATER